MVISGPIRIAVDIGGTFTDLQILDETNGWAHAHKTPTTPDDPSRGLLTGIQEAAVRHGFNLNQVAALMHGTTIATNAVLQRQLARGALITTAGFEDVLEIGRHVRRDVYAAKAEERALLIPRARRYGIRERILADGSIETPLTDDELTRIVARVRESGVEAVAVSLLHAYRNSEHEKRIERTLADAMPDLPVSLSHVLSPEIREYERTSTTVLNALLLPIIRDYISRLTDRLTEAGLTAPVFLVQSNGGVTTPTTAAAQPARLLLSGPSGGALAAETISARISEPNLIAVDMGGTSYDVSIVHGGEIRKINDGAVDSLPVRLPMVEIRTIGAGGGSLARVDDSGRLRVGPESAGAEPGPSCYGLGGDEPTVTDANVVLGRLDPNYFLGGALTLDGEAARRTIASRIAEPLGLEVEAAGEGVLRIAVSAMASAIRLSLFEKGLDPKDFALISFGGAGGLHACETASELGVARVVFPRDPGTLSAWGMLYADIVHDLAASRLLVAKEAAVPHISDMAADLRRDAEVMLSRDGIPAEAQTYPMTLDLRYRGQAYEIGAPLEAPENLADAVTAFHRLHEQQYAHSDETATTEMVTLRLAATGRLAKPAERSFEATGGAESKGSRRCFVEGSWQHIPVIERDAIGVGDAVDGPAIIEETHSTAYLPPGWTIGALASGELLAICGEGTNR